MKKKRYVLWIIVAVIALFVCILLRPTQFYQTTDISDYGHITGNCDNRTPSAYISAFFPEDISEEYVDVVYSYRAENADTYGYEAYLEFRIEDPKVFAEFINSVAPNTEWTVFAFDADYMEYCIDDELHLSEARWSQEAEAYYYGIEYAKIGKVLYSEQNQSVIFVAIGVYDGGGVNTLFLSAFFDRFHIDPAQYSDGGNI